MKILGIALVAFGLFLLQKFIYEKLWNRNLKVSISFARQGMKEGAEGELIEVIENRKRLPLSMLKVKFQTSRNLEFQDEKGSKTTDRYYRNDVFQINGGEKITRKLSFIARKRGYYCINGIDIIGSDLFLSQEFVKSMSDECFLYVYPKVYDSREFQRSLQQLNGEVISKRHLLEDPFEYRGIREYQPFDDMRSVNWKATARTGVLKVNQKNYTALHTIRIFLNTEDSGILKKNEAVEASLQIVMGLSEYFLAQGICVAVYSNGRDILTKETLQIRSSAGAGQGAQIGKGLARLDTEQTPYSFGELYREMILEEAQSTITVFVSPNGYNDFTDIMQECLVRQIAFVWYYAVEGKDEPEVDAGLSEHTHFIHISK